MFFDKAIKDLNASLEIHRLRQDRSPVGGQPRLGSRGDLMRFGFVLHSSRAAALLPPNCDLIAEYKILGGGVSRDASAVYFSEYW